MHLSNYKISRLTDSYSIFKQQYVDSAFAGNRRIALTKLSTNSYRFIPQCAVFTFSQSPIATRTEV